jgi:hypothetical protein
MTDWDSIRIRSRAAQSLPDELPAPTPVVSATPEGDHPLGDATLWASQLSERINIPGGDGPFVYTTGQVIRAQVADRRARRWGWQMQIALNPIPGVPVPLGTLDAVVIEWTLGAGLITIVQRYDATVALLVGALTGWRIGFGAGGVEAFIHELPGGLSDVIGETVAARLVTEWTLGEGDGSIQFDARMFLTPRAIAS